MSENISDFLSVVILISMPLTVLIIFLRKLFSKRIVHKKEESGKYYPEW